MYGYDAARTSHAPDRDLPPADAEPERLTATGAGPSAGGSIEAPPVVADGTVYAAGDIRVEARDAETGARRWDVDPEDGVGTSPVLGCGAVYVGATDRTLALDPADGTVLWEAAVGSGFRPSESPVAVDDTLFMVGSSLTALDAETGDERWTARPGHSPHGVAVAERVYVGAGSNGSGEVAAFTRDGDEWWRTTEPGEVYSAPAAADDLVFAVSKTGTLTALSATDGRVEWQSAVESGVHESPAVGAGHVVVGAGNGRRTLAFDAATGDRRWSFETGVSAGAPAVIGDAVLASGANTGIYALDIESGARIRHWPAGNVGSQPVVAGGRLYYRAWNVSDIFVIG